MTLDAAITLPSLCQKLQDGGYEDFDQVRDSSVFELTEELGLNKEEVEHLIKVCDKEPKVLKRSLGDIIAAEREYSISTSCKNFDRLLEFGVPPFKITEICGESGSGKTQLCMQLAINVQLSKNQGGVEGECLYIDTEGSFQYSRLISMSKKHNVESILNSVHLLRVLDHSELLALVRQLPDILQHFPKIKLIVIDSIAYHFRVNVLDPRARVAILDYVAQTLIEVANKNSLSVVVSNHVTTDGVDTIWTPSLGSSWGYWCANRLFLFRKREFRFGYLYKSVENEGSKPVQFCIKDEGIVDPEEDELLLAKQDDNLKEEEEEISNRINATWEGLKADQIKQEEDTRHLSDIHTLEQSNLALNNTEKPPYSNNTQHQDNAPIESTTQNQTSIEPSAPIDNTKRKTSYEDSSQKRPKIDTHESDYWASDMEEELDLDFLSNIHSYF